LTQENNFTKQSGTPVRFVAQDLLGKNKPFHKAKSNNMREIKIKVWGIEEHPNQEKVFTWIRNNWHDLNQYSSDEIKNAIEKLTEIIGGKHNYSFGETPSRGQFISFSYYDKAALENLKADDCPLTGSIWDIELIEGLKEGSPSKVLKALHEDSEYQYSDEGLIEHCKANEYEFKENGEFFAE
jgi:hypothetical protein